MQPFSAVAIFVLFWVLCLFLVLPFGVRTSDEEGQSLVPGQAESAPHSFSLARAGLRATIVALVLFGLYYANYVNGWIGPDRLDWLN